MRLLIAFCVGIAATLAWQSYGDMARDMIAHQSPQLGWLAPQPATAQAAPAAIVSPVSSADPQALKAISLDLAALRQRVELLAAGQNQMMREITARLQAAQQEIVDKVSASPPQPAPAAAPVRRSAAPPLQLAPAR